MKLTKFKKNIKFHKFKTFKNKQMSFIKYFNTDQRKESK